MPVRKNGTPLASNFRSEPINSRAEITSKLFRSPLPSRKQIQRSRNVFPSAHQRHKKPIDSSARNPLIYIVLTGMPSGLRPALGGKGRRENVQMESKTCRLLAEMPLSAVRKNPQEPA